MIWVNIGIVVFVVVIVIMAEIADRKTMIKCNWCGVKHRGRCIYNPRAGKFFSNSNDGYFNNNDPNK